MNRKSKGFTLIELLVVIAIIGILAALVLVALGNARAKANDARIKSNVSQLRTLAEVYYDSHDASYAGLDGCLTSAADDCASVSAQMVSLADDTELANGSAAPTIVAAADSFCISAALKTAGVTCVDSTGAYGTVACGTATACPAAAAP